MAHSSKPTLTSLETHIPHGLDTVKASRRSVLGYFSGLVGLASTSMAWAASRSATSFRVHDHGSHTRIVLELSEGAEFSVFQLPDPLRTVVDLPEISWDMPDDTGHVGTGVIRDLRYGLFQPGQSRVVLDLAQPANVDKAFLLAPTGTTPWRLVIDLKPVSQAAFMGQAGPAKRLVVNGPAHLPVARATDPNPRPIETARNDLGLPVPQKKPAVRPADRKPIIAIDPGHGGVDPGAIGVSGVREKDITLAAAQQFKKSLDATGRYKAVLTRSRDVSLGLRQRITIARRASADIFISLHADSIGRSDVRGLSVYTLSETASDKEAGKLAEKENKADLIIGMDLTNESTDVRNILIDLAQRESMNLAAKLAEELISQLQRQVTLLRNTHRFAGFAVLKAPDVPSVLMEMGYLSNREDEKLLKQSAYRQKLVASTISSLDRYFAEINIASRT